MKIQILKSKNAQFYWRIVASNGRILATSETYTTKASCQKTARNVRLGFILNPSTIENLIK